MNFIDILGFVVVYQNLHLKLHQQIVHQLHFVIIIYLLVNNNKIHQMEIQIQLVLVEQIVAFIQVIIIINNNSYIIQLIIQIQKLNSIDIKNYHKLVVFNFILL